MHSLPRYSATVTVALAAILLGRSRSIDDDMGWTGVLDEAAFAALHELKEGAAPALRGEEIEVGETRAYLSRPPDATPIGAVIVIHEWWGLNDHVKHWADRLASDGYVALAVDLYGGRVATTRDEALEAMRAVDGEAARATLLAASRYLAESPDIRAERTACIGWCFGGGWSLNLALAEPELDAAVIYYGRLVTDKEQLGAIRAQVLGIFGTRDEGIPPASVAEFEAAMDEAGVELELHSYDAEHAFANPSAARYDAEHASAAWEVTRSFLCRTLWPEQSGGSFSDGSRSLEVEAPAGWSDQGEKPMRLASFSLGDETECYVSALPGDAGGVEANLNRWREQLGAPPLSESELEALPRIPMLGRMVVSMRVEGTFRPVSGPEVSDAVLLGAICELEDEMLFVKLVGRRAEVVDAAEHFAPFCRGLR